MPLDAKLCTALVAAQRAIKAVPHDKTNTFHRYGYTSSEAIFREAREALLANGLAAVMTGWTLDGEAAVKVTFALFHESGESASFEVVAPALVEKGRPLDKAVSGALTLAESYWLRGLLLIPRVADSEDVAGRDDTAYQPPAPKSVPTAKPLEVGESDLKELTLAMKRHNIGREELLSYCRSAFGIEGPRLLSKVQFSELLAWVRLVEPEEAA